MIRFNHELCIIYGLTTSGKLWAEELTNYLLEKGFKQSPVDPCLLIKREKNGKYLKLINYVDDMLFYGDSDTTENTFFKDLKSRFSVNLLGGVHWYLGFKISRLGDDYVIDQARYALNMTEKFLKCANIKPRNSPLPLEFDITKKDMTSTPEETKQVNDLFGDLHYRSATGALPCHTFPVEQGLTPLLLSANLQSSAMHQERSIIKPLCGWRGV